ncbi:MAG: DUF1684 domain-containing protein [Gemmatimonadales bacterium]
MRLWLAAGLWLLAHPASDLSGQVPAAVLRERTDYVAWLDSAVNSPLAAIALQPIGPGIRLGPSDAEVPLAGVTEHRLSERGGVVTLEGPAGRRVLPRGLPLRLGPYTVMIAGAAGRGVATVFGPHPGGKTPGHYPYDRAVVFTGPLAAPEKPGRVRVLGIDGVEVEATEAGTVSVPVGGEVVRLRVLRMPGPGEESELEIFFRDATNGEGTYPAGRFVSLIPEGGRYRLDFNRARNPFCAYSTAYPCPAPWRGNTIGAPVRAGERYTGGGLEVPPVSREGS